MGFGLTSPISGLAPIQIGWSGTLVPLKGTTLADGNDHKSHRESAGFQRQQGSNQTGSESNAKAPASAGRGQPHPVGSALSLHCDGQQWAQSVGGWAGSEQAPWKVPEPGSPTWGQSRECHHGRGQDLLLPSGCHVPERPRESCWPTISVCQREGNNLYGLLVLENILLYKQLFFMPSKTAKWFGTWSILALSCMKE